MMNLKRRKTLLFIALAALLPACGVSAESLVGDGNQAFARDEFLVALGAYQSAQLENPELAEPYYNAANALYREGLYEEALQQMNLALAAAQTESLSQMSYFNQGNSAFQTQDYASAVEHYAHALLIDPDDQEAKYNLELALQQSEQQQQEQEEQQEQDSSESNEGQDQNQQEKSKEGDQSEQEQNAQEENQNQSDDSQDQGEQNRADQQQSDQGDPQDGSQEQGNDTQGDQQSDETPQGGQPQEEGENQASGQPRLVEGMTAEQAQQLLAAIAGNSDTLMERLGQFFYAPSGPPVQDW